MSFFLGPLKYLAQVFVSMFFDRLLKFIIEWHTKYQQKKDQDKIEKDNLAKIKEAKTNEEREKARTDLLNGIH